MSYHDARDPELLGMGGTLRPAGSDVRAHRLVDAPRAPVPGFGMVGDLHDPHDPMSCRSDTDLSGTRRDNALRRPCPRPTCGPTSRGSSRGGRELGLLPLGTCATTRRANIGADARQNPLPAFTTSRHRRVRRIRRTRLPRAPRRHTADRQLAHARRGGTASTRRGTRVYEGCRLVTRVINHVMRSDDGGSTAIFLVWDDWGGFYDHVEPSGSTRTATASACQGS